MDNDGQSRAREQNGSQADEQERQLLEAREGGHLHELVSRIWSYSTRLAGLPHLYIISYRSDMFPIRGPG